MPPFANLRRTALLPAVLIPLVISRAHGQVKPAAITTLGEIKGVRVEDVLPSPDGKLIAYTVMSELRVFDVAKKTSISVSKGPVDALLSWSSTGDAIAFIRDRDSDYQGYIWSLPVNPATGAAKGPAQRVTMSKVDDSGVFSSDGKSLAFFTDTQGRRLVVVPATGGPERTVATFPKHTDVIDWSADGKKIRVATVEEPPVAGAPSPYSLEEVSVNDGSRRQLLALRGCYSSHGGPYVLDYGCGPLGVNSVVRAIDKEGRVAGSFKTPADIHPVGMISGSALLRRVDAPVTLAVLSIADGRSHQIGQVDLKDMGPWWSADAKRLALRTTRNERTLVVIMNADGSARREIPVADIPPTTGNIFLQLKWSPDGRSLAFLADSGRGINAMDVATGSVRRIVTVSDPSRAGIFEWTPDSRGVHFLQRPLLPQGGGKFSIHGAQVDGGDRELGDVTRFFAQARRFRFVTDSTLIAIKKDSTFVFSVDGRVVQRFAGGAGRWMPAVSANGELIASAYVAPGGTYNYTTIEVLSTRDGSRRELAMPFEVSTGLGAVPMFLPDGKRMLVPSAPTATSGKRIWLVSLDGEQPRPIATLSDNVLPSYMDLSADGRSLAYTHPAAPTTTFFKADFSSLLKP